MTIGVNMIKRDEYLNKLILKKWNGMIKVITGIRRCGKSYLLFKIFKNHLLESGVSENHIIEVVLDTPEAEQLRNVNKLNEHIKSKIVDKSNYYVLLDEIQLVEGFEFLLNGLLYLENVDCYVTGSNSKFLSSDIITEFRGRGDELRVHPLSFKEFYEAYNGDKHKAYDEYSLYGGLPQILNLYTHEAKTSYLLNLMNNVYLSDIIERHNLKNKKDILTDLLNIISSSIGSFTSPSKLTNVYDSLLHLKINRMTICHYLNSFSDAFLIHKVFRFDIKGNKYINSIYKYYFEDIGLRNAWLNYRQNEPTHILENIIYNELTLRGYSLDIGIVEYNYKDENKLSKRKQFEIDFIARKYNEKYYIQVAYALDDKDKINQETRGLNRINDSFKKIVIVKDLFLPYRDEKGIVFIGLEEFLLDKDSLIKY